MLVARTHKAATRDKGGQVGETKALEFVESLHNNCKLLTSVQIHLATEAIDKVNW